MQEFSHFCILYDYVPTYTLSHVYASRCACVRTILCVSRCVYLVTHNACMRARLDDDSGLDCFLEIPRLDLVHNPLRECMCIRNRT